MREWLAEENKNKECQEMEEVISIDSYLRALRGLGEGDTYKRDYFFRGHANIDWSPIPGIYRNNNWIANEDLMIKDLISRCPDEFRDHRYTFQSLVKMQHYSLPTRLLDITGNPLIALYFACQPVAKGGAGGGDSEANGEVIVFCATKDCIKYFDSDTVSVISNIARRPKSFDLSNAPRSEREVDSFNATETIKLLLHEIGHEKPHFESKILRSDLESVVFVRPLLDNPRIIRQEGAFILFGIAGNKMEPAKILEIYYPRVKRPRLVVPAVRKREILCELEVLGVSDSTVFPDVENVAKFIKSKYQ